MPNLRNVPEVITISKPNEYNNSSFEILDDHIRPYVSSREREQEIICTKHLESANDIIELTPNEIKPIEHGNIKWI